jgi:hypothetical protein
MIQKTKRIKYILIWILLILASCRPVDFEDIEEKDCKIYLDDNLFTGNLVYRHDNGRVSKEVNVLNGIVSGHYKNYDYLGGVLEEGVVFSSGFKDVRLKKYVEGAKIKGEESRYFYTIGFCKDDFELNSQVMLIIEQIKDSFEINPNDLGVYISNSQIYSEQYLFFGYNTPLGNVPNGTFGEK